MCASVCICMYLCACELRFMQKPEALSPLELDLQAVMKYLTYVVGTELRCFANQYTLLAPEPSLWLLYFHIFTVITD